MLSLFSFDKGNVHFVVNRQRFFFLFNNRFSGLNIMLVTMASRIATLMLSLIEELELENVPQVSSPDEKAHVINYLTISTQCSAWQRMQWLLSRNHIPKQLWKLFCSAYSMVILCQLLLIIYFFIICYFIIYLLFYINLGVIHLI